MSSIAKIAPGVWVSSDVLSPEWGREHRRKLGDTAEAPRTVTHLACTRPGASEHSDDAPENGSEQMSLL